MKIELKKKGTFSVPQSSNPGRCGKENLVAYAYEVTLWGRSTALDSDDFLVDHNAIGKYFEETYRDEKIILSCEMMAMRAVRYFWEKYGLRLSRIEVDIIADNVSHRAIWDVERDTQPVIPESRGAMSKVTERWEGVQTNGW